uniref:Uncharacterized protein n=1 Tax=Siphoviridae sp. ctXZx16 TaxID=2826371 RepID=A0A8S5ML09_9CAUD|nr:MAG TPA: hypothetical protein [Siphoviridae sp. ctXZx16]
MFSFSFLNNFLISHHPFRNNVTFYILYMFLI